MLKFYKNTIYNPLALKIERKDKDMFVFSDINPSVEFRNRLTKYERLQLCLFFFIQVFKK